MVYHQAVILLCCPFVSGNTQFPSPREGDTMQHPPQSNDKQQPNSRYAKGLSSCCNSIRVMCCIAQRYRQTFGSFKLSPITATHCTLSTALMLIELCCAAKPVAKHSPTDDGPHRLTPHAAVALCFQVLRELSTSWNIAKRIGRNLERVYIQRYGSEHLAFMPKEGEENSQVLLQESKSTPAGKFGIPNLEMFDDILNARPFITEDPIRLLRLINHLISVDLAYLPWHCIPLGISRAFQIRMRHLDTRSLWILCPAITICSTL